MKQSHVPKISNLSAVCYVEGWVDAKRDWPLVEFSDVREGAPE